LVNLEKNLLGLHKKMATQVNEEYMKNCTLEIPSSTNILLINNYLGAAKSNMPRKTNSIIFLP